ncbi:MAG: TerB family tellurite resistance protein [Rhizobiaceae bacterium]|nr:TerB family tellurite resistance protein [Rhizobiaceae bacterium]MCV0407625.1 TerB family tellurite resistance protein [Rhizobiaceae bacterium]
MIDRLLTFLRDLPGAPPGKPAFGLDDPRVAAAALLFHVMDADGVRRQEEVDRLHELVAGTWSLSGRELDSVIEAGEEADRDAVDLYAFTSVLMRHLDHEARLKFIGLMWEVVYADRERHEMEDNLVWRVAELTGISSRERVLLRRSAAARMGVAVSGDDDD